MRRIAALALALVVMAVGWAGVATAQVAPAEEVTCEEATSTFDGLLADARERAAELNIGAGIVAEAEAALAGGVSTGERLALLRHVPVLTGVLTDADVKLLADLEVAANVRQEACTATPPPVDPDEDVIVGDLDCKDFPLPDGRTALDVYNEDPATDRHNLDADNNGIPCEFGDKDGFRDTSDNYRPDTSDGIATGGA